MIRAAAGRVAVATLKRLARLPVPLAHALGLPLIPFYLLLRPGTWRRLAQAAPAGAFKPVFALTYYSMRLRLVLLSLRHLLGRPDGCLHVVENENLYHAALATGRPVALLGWHQGPVERLHLVPHADPVAAGRPRVLVTAGAFSPALAEFMRAGRTVDGKEIARPGDLHALRRWERGKGVLAVMIDQVPGPPEEYLAVRRGAEGRQVLIPWPRRLVDWIIARDPVILAVTARFHAIPDAAPDAATKAATRGRIVFGYRALGAASAAGLKDDMARRLEDALRRNPDQYNWSYPKIRFPD